MSALNRFADPVFCITRLIIGLLFACHGGQKILDFPPGGHGPSTEMLGIVGGWIELVAGFMIALGLLTRLAAFIASGEMAYAYFKMHHSMTSFFPIQNHGEAAVFYCFFFLFVVFHGPGRWSIDAMIGKGKAATAASAT
jgi:putative oxidoreductase